MPNSLNSGSSAAELLDNFIKKNITKIFDLFRPIIQSEDSEYEDGLNNEIPLNQLQNGPTRNDILSSDSENEAEAVTKNAQTSAESAQTSAEIAQTSGEQVPRPKLAKYESRVAFELGLGTFSPEV